MIKQAYMDEEWFAILSERVSQSNAKAVAAELGYSKTALSLILNGKYKGKPDCLRDKVIFRFVRVNCPHQKQVIPMYECVGLAHSPAPTHNPIKMQQWRACQSCPKRPKETAK